jgi:hypothetical protein
MNEVSDLLGWEGSAWMQAGDAVRETLSVIASTGRYVEDGLLTDELSSAGKETLKKFRWMEHYLMENFQKRD